MATMVEVADAVATIAVEVADAAEAEAVEAATGTTIMTADTTHHKGQMVVVTTAAATWLLLQCNLQQRLRSMGAERLFLDLLD